MKLTNVLTIEELKQQKEKLFNAYGSINNATYKVDDVQEKENIRIGLQAIGKCISDIDVEIARIEIEMEGK